MKQTQDFLMRESVQLKLENLSTESITDSEGVEVVIKGVPLYLDIDCINQDEVQGEASSSQGARKLATYLRKKGLKVSRYSVTGLVIQN